MHAVVVTVTVKDVAAAKQALASEIVPGVKSQPGFVAGYWLDAKDNRGMSVTLWRTEEDANKAAEMIRTRPAVSPVAIDSIEVREVVANA